MTDRLSSLPKFEVGQFVQLATDNPLGSDIKSVYHIVERAVQECPAGTQIWYTCRGHHLKYRERTVTLQLIKFNEIELGEVVENTKNPADDIKSQLVDLLAKIEDKEAMDKLGKEAGL